MIDRDDGHAFGFAVKDGYCGWLEAGAVGPALAATHWVAAVGTHLYPEARVQARAVAAVSQPQWRPMTSWMTSVRGAGVGDLRVVSLPSGTKEWEVLAISYD